MGGASETSLRYPAAGDKIFIPCAILNAPQDEEGVMCVSDDLASSVAEGNFFAGSPAKVVRGPPDYELGVGPLRTRLRMSQAAMQALLTGGCVRSETSGGPAFGAGPATPPRPVRGGQVAHNSPMLEGGERENALLQQLETAQTERAMAVSVLDNFKAKEQDMCLEIQQLREELDGVRARERDACAKLEAAMGTMRDELAVETRQRREKGKEVEILRAQVVEAQQHAMRIAQELEDKKGELSSLRTQLEAAHMQLNEVLGRAGAEKAALEARVACVEGELREAGGRLAALGEAAEALQSENSALKDVNSGLERAVETVEEEAACLRLTVAVGREDLQREKALSAGLREDNERLEGKLLEEGEKAKAFLGEAKARRAELERRVGDLERRLAASRRVTDGVKREGEVAAEAARRMERRAIELEAARAAEARGRAVAEARVAELQGEASGLGEAVQDLEAACRERYQELVRLQGAAREDAEGRRMAEAEVATLRVRVAELEEKAGRLTGACDRGEDALKQATEDLQKMARLLEDAEAGRREAEQQAGAYLAAQGSLKLQLEMATDQEISMRERVAAAEVEKEGLRQEVEGWRLKYEALEARLHDMEVMEVVDISVDGEQAQELARLREEVQRLRTLQG